MTPEERADAVCDKLDCFEMLLDENRQRLKSLIAAEIRAAVEEATANVLDLGNHNAIIRMKEKQIATAKAEAYEDAAQIAEKAPMQPGSVIFVAEVRRTEPYVTGQEWADHIAAKIRARVKEVAG